MNILFLFLFFVFIFLHLCLKLIIVDMMFDSFANYSFSVELVNLLLPFLSSFSVFNLSTELVELAN